MLRVCEELKKHDDWIYESTFVDLEVRDVSHGEKKTEK
jgi:hypothetical protein